MKDQIYECYKELRQSIAFAKNALSMSGDTIRIICSKS